VVAIIHGSLVMSNGAYNLMVGSVAMASGLALLAGFLTPIVGTLTALGAIGLACSWLSSPAPS